jgi:hypothetical protein
MPEQSPGKSWDDVDATLSAVFSGVERISGMPERGIEPYSAYGIGPGVTLLFRGDALRMLRELERELALHALTGAGWTPDTVSGLVVQACELSETQGETAAIAWLHQTLESPPSRMTVFVHSQDMFPGTEFVVGACTLSRTAPPSIAQLSEGSGPGLAGPFISTVVTAGDRASAKVIGWDRIDEARAILALAHRGRIPQARPATAVEAGGKASFSLSSNRLHATDHIDSENRWHHGYRELSEAASRDAEDRTDWERRVIAACRWYSAACQTRWYAEALVNAVISLECLFLPPDVNRSKGQRIALAVTQTGIVLPGKTVRSQRKWIDRMYGARNSVAHEAGNATNDLEIEDLLILGRATLDWAVWHLTPLHRTDAVICRSLAEVSNRDAHA